MYTPARIEDIKLMPYFVIGLIRLGTNSKIVRIQDEHIDY